MAVSVQATHPHTGLSKLAVSVFQCLRYADNWIVAITEAVGQFPPPLFFPLPLILPPSFSFLSASLYLFSFAPFPHFCLPSSSHTAVKRPPKSIHTPKSIHQVWEELWEPSRSLPNNFGVFSVKICTICGLYSEQHFRLWGWHFNRISWNFTSHQLDWLHWPPPRQNFFPRNICSEACVVETPLTFVL